MSDDVLRIQVKGLDELLHIVSFDVGALVRGVLMEVGGLVKTEISREPGPVHKPIEWASQKQRKYVMALIRKYGPWVRGEGFEGGGPRSQHLSKSWKVEAESDYKVVVSSSASYGPWVQSAESPGGQQPFHANTGWRTDEGVVQYVAMSRDVERIAGEHVERVLGGR